MTRTLFAIFFSFMLFIFIKPVFSQNYEKCKNADGSYDPSCTSKIDRLSSKLDRPSSKIDKPSSDISNIEKICLSFGYKKGTEKYADCMKDLYLQQNAANNSNSNNSSSSYSNSRYADEMLEIERAKAKAQEDSARAQRNRNQSDALMDISRSLLNNNRAPATTNQPLNCRSVKVGNTVQTQCY